MGSTWRCHHQSAGVTDKNGIVVPQANNHIHFNIEGPGEIAATDNGDPTSFEPFQSPQHSAFNGLALVIVRAKRGQAGMINLSAQSDSIDGVSIALQSVTRISNGPSH